jgi:MFS transporter, FHS family, glucose/mannose:H+ symporter
VTVLFLATILVGVASTMLGPLMPGFEARWRLDDAHGGVLFIAQFVASVLATACVGFLARWMGYWRLCAVGLLVATAGIAGCATACWGVTVAAVAVYGAGLGAIIPAANLGVAAAAPGDSARRVLWLNLFWSIGAVTAPVLVAYLKSAFLPTLAAGFGVMAFLVAIGGAGKRPAAARHAAADGLPHVRFAVMLFLYVGSESSIAGWVSAYATRSPGAESLWAVLPSVFWGAILAGRLIAPNILHRVRPPVLAPWCLAMSLAGAVLLLAISGPLAMLAGTAIAGLGFAPIFPVVVASYADRTGGGSLSGLVFCAAGLGGAAVPPLVGFASTASGSLRTGLAVILVFIVAMLRLTQTVMPAEPRTQ